MKRLFDVTPRNAQVAPAKGAAYPFKLELGERGMIFWWTGRGYLALLSLIGVFGLFGALLTLAFGEQIFDTAPWLWAVGAVIAAVVNWVVGCRVNRKPLKVPRLALWKSRLSYRPPNRFMGLPLEVWSAPMMLLAAVMLVRGLLPA